MYCKSGKAGSVVKEQLWKLVDEIFAIQVPWGIIARVAMMPSYHTHMHIHTCSHKRRYGKLVGKHSPEHVASRNVPGTDKYKPRIRLDAGPSWKLKSWQSGHRRTIRYIYHMRLPSPPRDPRLDIFLRYDSLAMVHITMTKSAKMARRGLKQPIHKCKGTATSMGERITTKDSPHTSNYRRT
jgi:hypothetical protein